MRIQGPIRRRAESNHAAPVPPHLRLAHDRGGCEREDLSDLHGHASITITLDRYGRLMPGSAAEAAGLLDTYLAAEQKRSATRVRGLVSAVDGLYVLNDGPDCEVGPACRTSRS